MDIELVEKYLYWLGRYLPARRKEEIVRDVKRVIERQIFEMKKENPTKDEREITKDVLLHLGAPYEVAAEYSGQTKTYLIGPRRYVRYIDTVKLTMVALIIAFVLTAFVKIFLGASDMWLSILWKTMWDMLPVLLMGYGFITLIFSLMEKRGTMAVFTEEKLLSLAAKPKKGEKISKSVSIIAIVLNIIMGVLLLMVPQYLAFYFGAEERVAIFQIFVLRSWWIVIVLWAAVGIAKNVFRLYDGRYTARVTLVTVVANACAILFAFKLFSDREIINPGFLTLIKDILENTNHTGLVQYLPYFSMVIGGIISFYYLVDSIWGMIKGWQYAKR